MIFIGMMSGSSLDGVDAVLADFSAQIRVLARTYVPYPATIRAEILALQTCGENELHRSNLLAQHLAKLYAQAALELKAAAPSPIIAIGCHGQTIRHAPEHGYSIQLNAPEHVAELTGIDVIANFRARDLAAGGQGAPLVPRFHQAVFSSPTETRVVLNLGGIANLTRLDPHQPIIGFDTGPANMLMDAWIFEQLGQPFDENGQWAATGTVDETLLARCLSEPFFHAPPPKSTGRDTFNLAWLKEKLRGNERPEDVQATLLELTAKTAAEGIFSCAPNATAVFLCGGGANNGALIAALSRYLPSMRIETTQSLGCLAQDVEALAFAWLAFAWHQRIAGNDPRVTGAHGARILGALYPA